MILIKRKVITSLVTCSLLISCPAIAAQEKQTFTDLSNHWALEQVEMIANQGLLFPLTDNQLFQPDQYITRAEFVFMLSQSLNLEQEGESEQPFADVTLDKWYAGMLIQAKKKGLIYGQEEGYFYPEDPISRAEVAVLIQRAYPNLAMTNPPIYFTDVYGIHWAEPEIEYATQSGLINGYSEHEYGPDQRMTRAEAAVLLSRLLSKNSKENPISIATVELEEKALLAQYTVEPGDSLWKIAQKYNTNVEDIMQTNQLESDRLQIGQALLLPESTNRWEINQNLDNFSEQDYNTIDNQIAENSGQVELLEWSIANNVLAIGKVARIIDVYSGETFLIKRFSGANHADVEPLTKNDTKIMNQIWGGPTWDTRPIIVEVEGRRLAAAMHNMPHDVQTITDNDFNGHTCIHFLGSTKHNNGQTWPEMQRDVQVAATHN